MSRANQWFVPGDGIAREVITADIQRYLGPDALVRPGPGTGEFEGRSGYWITAYRTLTSQMIQDLKMDSTRWQQEQGRQEAGRGVAYQDSRTHAARQHWGPTEGYDQARQSSRSQYAPQQHTQQYASSEQHYTTTPTASSAYGSSHQAYQVPAASHAAPRTQPDPYAYSQQPGRDHPAYASTPQYAYPQQTAQDYGRQQAAPPPTHGYPAQSTAVQPGYYIASDGRQYPLPAAQTPAQPPQGRSRRPGN